MKSYVYLWLDESGVPYYVGSGNLRRVYFDSGHHIRRPVDENRIIVEEYADRSEAFAAEKFFIGFYGKSCIGEGPLMNKVGDGKGIGKPKGRVLSFRVSAPVKEALKELAYADRRTIGSLIRIVLERELGGAR